MIKKYKEYKDSGVEWLGDLPAEWQVLRLNRIAKIVTGTTPSMKEEDNYAEEGFMWIKPDNLNELDAICDTKGYLSVNVKELDRVLADMPKESFDIDEYKFIFDDYDKYDPSYGDDALDQQIKNFYVNLKKISFGYAQKDIEVVEDQGNGVLQELSQQYGCRDYFKGHNSFHAASADTVIVAPAVPTDARHVISGSTVVIKPGSNKIGENNE